ncbi:MAG: tRNA (adenosine(37)-N6)-threonylcarbamoyltransferase complex ATPase subunit type 1 TsaE [Flavobacteriales bacterium]|jgi:tRNA threonylcarbamoyladenosine biosynthesis protein TsaE
MRVHWQREGIREDRLREAAAELAEVLRGVRPLGGVVVLDGDMGAGKTTTVRALGAALGILDEVSSPTFALVHEYASRTGTPVVHMDLYRIEDEAEAAEAGVGEYYAGPGLCFVEWADRAAGLLPPDALRLRITAGPEGERVWELRVP